MFVEDNAAAPTHAAVVAMLMAARALVDARIEVEPLDVQAASMRGMRACADLIELAYSRTLSSFERRGGPSAAGATSAIEWARRECNLSGAAAHDRVRVGRQIDELPLVAAAVEKGEIGFEHAAVLSRTAAEVPPAAREGIESVLLAEARKADPAQLRKAAQSYRHEVDAIGFLGDALAKRERRYLRLSERSDGMTILDGLLDPEGGALVRTALRPWMLPEGADDRRTAERRRADALVELCRRQAYGGGSTTRTRRRPQVLVIASDATMRGEPGAPAAQMGGAMVPAETAQRIACDATVTVVRVDANGQPRGPGRTHRTVTPNEWAALVARDGGCRWPQARPCGASLDECEADHLDSWVYTHTTDIRTTVLLCQKHHHMKHEGGWTLVGDPARTLVAIPPRADGRPAPVPPGTPGARTWREPPGVRRGSRRAAAVRAGPT
jgi:hypothetical protein